MKRYAIMLLVAFISIGCNGQLKEDKSEKTKANDKVINEPPKGSWEVNKEFDEAGNLIRYDSIYSWSSGDELNNLSTFDRDSTLKSMQSRFYRNFSQFDFDKEGFGDLFAEDSIFTKRFFNNDFFDSEFGEDFMDIDKMYDRMEAMQKQFLGRYEPLIRPEKEGDSVNQNE